VVSKRARGLKVAQAAVLALPLVIFAALLWRYRIIYDDGFIYLRVVQQILAGHGPVFNTGQRVEVFTSPLWVFILAFVGLVTPLSLEWIAVVLGGGLCLAGTALVIVGAVRLGRRVAPDAFLLPLGALILVALFPMWTLGTAGLETGLTLGWLGLSFFLFVRWCEADRRAKAPWYLLVVLGLGPLVRPELAVNTVVLLVTAAVLTGRGPEGQWAPILRVIGLALAVPFAYEVFRMGYYGELVANTAIAKEAASPRPSTGFAYLWNFVRPYGLLVPLILLVVGAYLPLISGLRARADSERYFWLVVAFPLAGLLNVGYIVLMGGDYFQGRLLIPGLFAMCAPVAVLPLARRFVVSLAIVPWALVCGIALRPPATKLGDQFSLQTSTSGAITISQLGWGPGGIRAAWYRGPGLYYTRNIYGYAIQLPLHPAPGEHLPSDALAGIGLVSYAMGPNLNVVDLLGLASPVDSHFELLHRGFIGHEKPFPTPWVIALMTANGSSVTMFDQLQPKFNVTDPWFPTYHGDQLALKAAWARGALRCPALRELQSSVSRPLSVGQFFSNVANSIGNTVLRISPDPEQAYRQTCGRGVPREVRELVEGMVPPRSLP
jgi:arabinofuranosyltransferase